MPTKLSQRDSRWAGILLGTSSKTIGTHGCTITCIAMLAGTTPDVVNEKLKNNGGYANTNLVIWSKIKDALPNLEFEWRGYGYDNDRVKKAIEDNGGCLVEVSGSRIGGDKHWVLFIGDGKMIDPWTGAEKSTGWYGSPTGYAIIKKTGESVGQTDLEACLQSHKDLLDQLVKEKEAHAETKTRLDGVKDELKDVRQKDQQFVDELKEILGPPVLADKSSIKGRIGEIMSVEDLYKKAQKELQNKDKEFETERSQFLARIEQLELANQSIQKQLDLLKSDIAKQKETETQFNWLKELLNIFKK